MFPSVYTWLKSSATVKSIIGTTPRAYRHDSAPQDTTKPYVTWYLISGTPENNLSDLPPTDRLAFQVDCWHQTDSGVEALAEAVRDAIEPYAHMVAIPINTKDSDTKLYRIGLQFEHWQSRAN